MSGWVLTAERKPTADDADERGMVWLMNKDTREPYLGHIDNVNAERLLESDGKVWHPKPKTLKPEPYKPPVTERVERWCHVNESGEVVAMHKTQCYADNNPYGNCRVAHLREVRDGDPSPEDVEIVIDYLRSFLPDYDNSHVRHCIRLLGGNP